MAGCTGAGAFRNAFCLLRLHGLHKGIIVLPRFKVGDFKGKSQRNLSIFANAFAYKRYKKQHILYSFSPRIMSAAAASASSSVKPPSAERKQFTELQQKYIDTTQKLKQLHSQFQQKSVEKQRALLTAKELSVSTNDDDKTETTNLYKPIGRGFVLRSREQIERELAQTVKKAEKMMDDCQNQRTFLEGKIEELERNLRELLHGNEGLQRELHEAGLLGGGGMM